MLYKATIINNKAVFLAFKNSCTEVYFDDKHFTIPSTNMSIINNRLIILTGENTNVY